MFANDSKHEKMSQHFFLFFGNILFYLMQLAVKHTPEKARQPAKVGNSLSSADRVPINV